jgi:outer membrane protein
MRYTLILFTLFLSSLAVADERGADRAELEPNGFLYGFGLGVNKEIYKGFDRRVIPLPIIGYRGDDLSIYGPFLNYDVLQVADIELQVIASPRFQGFDDSDSDIFIGMEKREFSMDAGLGAKYERNNWKIGFSALHDILNRSGGYELQAKLSKVFKSGPVFYEPNLSVNYLDKDHVDYYYGVRANEVSNTRSFYQGEAAVNTAIGFSVSTPIFLGGFTQLAIDYNLYDNAITDSPLVEDDSNISFRLLFSKMF